MENNRSVSRFIAIFVAALIVTAIVAWIFFSGRH